MRMRRRALLLIPGFLMLAAVAAARQRPLITEDVELVKPGNIRFQLGFDFNQNQRFGLSGLDGDLTRVGVVGVYFGLSPNAQFEVSGVVHNYLNIEGRGLASIPLDLSGRNHTRGSGDFTLAAKFKIMNETGWKPAVGFRFGVQLPNSDERRGIGTNTTNAFGTIILGKHFLNDRLNVFGNLGLAILTNPLVGTAQNDVILYGAAAMFKATGRLNLVGEVNGRHSTRRPFPGTESLGEARVGFQYTAAGLRWDSAFIKGYTPFSPRYGFTLGLTSEFPAFTPVR